MRHVAWYYAPPHRCTIPALPVRPVTIYGASKQLRIIQWYEILSLCTACPFRVLLRGKRTEHAGVSVGDAFFWHSKNPFTLARTQTRTRSVVIVSGVCECPVGARSIALRMSCLALTLFVLYFHSLALIISLSFSLFVVLIKNILTCKDRDEERERKSIRRTHYYG